MRSVRSGSATRRQFLTAGGAALAGAVLSGGFASAGSLSPSRGGSGSGSTATATATPTATPTPTATRTPTSTPSPAPTPATVTIPVPVIQQSMVLDCETAALQQGLAYYGINVTQPALFALENADTRLPVADAQFRTAQAAWDAFTSPGPTNIDRFIAPILPRCRFLPLRWCAISNSFPQPTTAYRARNGRRCPFFMNRLRSGEAISWSRCRVKRSGSSWETARCIG